MFKMNPVGRYENILDCFHLLDGDVKVKKFNKLKRILENDPPLSIALWAYSMPEVNAVLQVGASRVKAVQFLNVALYGATKKDFKEVLPSLCSQHQSLSWDIVSMYDDSAYLRIDEELDGHPVSAALGIEDRDYLRIFRPLFSYNNLRKDYFGEMLPDHFVNNLVCQINEGLRVALVYKRME